MHAHIARVHSYTHTHSPSVAETKTEDSHAHTHTRTHLTRLSSESTTFKWLKSRDRRSCIISSVSPPQATTQPNENWLIETKRRYCVTFDILLNGIDNDVKESQRSTQIWINRNPTFNNNNNDVDDIDYSKEGERKKYIKCALLVPEIGYFWNSAHTHTRKCWKTERQAMAAVQLKQTTIT